MSDSFPEVYNPQERLIYHYFAGDKDGIRQEDPMVLYKRLMEVRGDLSGDIAVAKSPSKGAPQAHEGMVSKIRKIFDLKTFAEGGLLDGECEALLSHFYHWCEWVKKNYRTSRTLQDATSETSPSPTEENQPTANTSDSGSISPEPQTV